MELGVDKLLTGLNPNKVQGPDEISPRLLKELHTEIAPILTIIFQRSLDTGIVPKDWKHAIITPAFKKGSKSKPSNYRPISLTCIASKLMEHIIVSSMMDDYSDTTYFALSNTDSGQNTAVRLNSLAHTGNSRQFRSRSAN